MSYRLRLIALQEKWLRPLADAWVAERRFDSLYDARAWVGAMQMSIASQLEGDEISFLATAFDRAGKAVLVLEFAREWPHKITNEVDPKKTNRRTR